MKKYACILSFFLVFATLKLAAQDTAALSARDEQIRAVLEMSLTDYKAYLKEVNEYGQRLSAIYQDSTLSREDKASALNNVRTAFIQYQQQNLSEQQRKALQDFEKSTSAAQNSPRLKQIQEMRDRLRKKGANVTATEAVQ